MANQPGDLVFKQHTRGDGLLVFGGTDGPSIEPAELSVDATFPELDASIRKQVLAEVDAAMRSVDRELRAD